MTPVGPTLLRVLVTLLGAVAVVAQVTYLDALSWHVLHLTPAMMELLAERRVAPSVVRSVSGTFSLPPDM